LSIIAIAYKENDFCAILPYFAQNGDAFILLPPIPHRMLAVFSYPKSTKMHKNKIYLCEYYEKLIFLHFLH
jgi:hypothetical protein